MARRSSRSRSTRSVKDRSASSSRGVPAAAEVEDDGSSGGETGIVILTTALLVAALLCVDAMLGRYGAGFFF